MLGGLSIRRDGGPVTGFISAKAQALVYYLAATGRSHTRDGLAGLLWSDVPDATARKNLRDVLSNLRRLIGPYLLITRQTAGLNPEAPLTVDSQRLSAALSDPEDMAALSDAVDLYQGDFLAGFYVPDAPLFYARSWRGRWSAWSTAFAPGESTSGPSPAPSAGSPSTPCARPPIAP
jgi:DNA-binding SARP family transcriptional activator